MFYVVCIVLIILFYFIKDSFFSNKKIKESGGLYSKYEILINLIKDNDMNMNIVLDKTDHIQVKGGGPTTIVIYDISWSYDMIFIEYSMKSRVTGVIGFKAKYDDELDQNELYENIVLRINSLFKEKGLL